MTSWINYLLIKKNCEGRVGLCEVTGIDKLYTISYLWYPSIGTATVVVVGLIVSFITGPMSIDEVDSKYLIPLFDRLFCCLPASWRSTLRCHKEFQDPDDIKADEKETEIVIPAITKPDSAFAVSFKPDIVNGNGNVTSFGNGRGSLKNDFGIASDNTSDGVYKTLSTQFWIISIMSSTACYIIIHFQKPMGRTCAVVFPKHVRTSCRAVYFMKINIFSKKKKIKHNSKEKITRN